ncbi:MAG: hypothetical protein HGN29_14840 [Asgard group archaeon]|nr:hypothetical protein [Asgard group archaeon]
MTKTNVASCENEVTVSEISENQKGKKIVYFNSINFSLGIIPIIVLTSLSIRILIVSRFSGIGFALKSMIIIASISLFFIILGLKIIQKTIFRDNNASRSDLLLTSGLSIIALEICILLVAIIIALILGFPLFFLGYFD